MNRVKGGMRRSATREAGSPRRGTQVVRERSAKPLCAGSIPARASNFFNDLQANSYKANCATVGTFVGTTCILPLFFPSLRHRWLLFFKGGNLLRRRSEEHTSEL